MALKAKPLAEVRADVPTHLVHETVQLNIDIPRSLRKSLRQAALDRDTTVTALVIETLTRELEAKKPMKLG
jgi:hypothetical protein